LSGRCDRRTAGERDLYFVGADDDLLVMRFNGQVVLDGSWNPHDVSKGGGKSRRRLQQDPGEVRQMPGRFRASIQSVNVTYKCFICYAARSVIARGKALVCKAEAAAPARPTRWRGCYAALRFPPESRGYHI
jgi:hypothetical protein